MNNVGFIRNTNKLTVRRVVIEWMRRTQKLKQISTLNCAERSIR